MAIPPVLFQETRVSAGAEPTASNITISTFGQASSQNGARKRGFDEINSLDEDGFAKRHLATDASIFFRPSTRFPRTFSWRVLNDRKLVEVQCVDLVQTKPNAIGDGRLTFRVEFKHAIREKCLALADGGTVDSLEIIALTTQNELFTITLKHDLLARQNAPLEFQASTCVKQYSSNALTFRHPYRLFAASNLELYISLSDGGFARLERAPHESGAQWRETFFNEGGLMGTLRGLNPLKRRQTVRYGDVELEPSTLAAIAKSPDGKHVWTVSLDHVLRAWSTTTWKVVHSMDLLNEGISKDGTRDKKAFMINAEVNTLLQIVTSPPPKASRALIHPSAEHYSLVVYSPKDHQVKFYRIKQDLGSLQDENALLVEDMQEQLRFIPPVEELMNTNIWTLSQYRVYPGPDWSNTQLWIRVRSGALCRTYSLTFDPTQARDDLAVLWKNGWAMVDQGSNTIDRLKQSLEYPGDLDLLVDSPITATEMWQAFLLQSNRFSRASLESALHIYKTGRGLTSTSNRIALSEQAPLETRLTDAIAAKVILHILPSKQPDDERYQSDIQAQWQVYFSLLAHLHDRRHDVLDLALDSEMGLSWSVSADFVAPIRACSVMERRVLNTSLLEGMHEGSQHSGIVQEIYPLESRESMTASRVLAIIRDFRYNLSASFSEKLRQAVMVEASHINSPNNNDSVQRVQILFEQCGFENEVTDDEFEALNLATEAVGGLGSLDNNALMTILEWLDREGEMAGSEGRQILDQFGTRFNMVTARATLELARSILFDLLALVVFMAGGLEENELDPAFRPGELYVAIISRLKVNEILVWLATNTRQEVVNRASSGQEERQTVNRTVTLLEDIFIGDWRAVNVKHATFAELVTLWSKAWVAGPDLEQNWDGVTAHIMGSLLRHKNIELAAGFQRFLTLTPWSTYLLARLQVATGEYTIASHGFREAAEFLSNHKNIAAIDTAHLLTAEERSFFGTGPARYHLHVTAMFEQLRNYSYTAEFAALALEATTSTTLDFSRSIAELDRKKSRVDSPAKDKMDNAIEELRLLKAKELRDEILNRLFNALVQTGHFSQAFDALQKIQDPPVRRSELKKLIETCVKQDDVPTLLGLSFGPDLADVADRILHDLAKRGLASASTPSHLPYHQILYAFRVQQGDFRGAAEILFELLERLRLSNDYALQNPEDETLPEIYALLINTLACCGEDEAWLLAAPIPGLHFEGQKRRLVTLADLRREYAAELDKRSEMMQGRFPMIGGGGGVDEMDVL